MRKEEKTKDYEYATADEVIKAIEIYEHGLLDIYKMRQSREMSLAITNLEQSVMWAIKAITKGA